MCAKREVRVNRASWPALKLHAARFCSAPQRDAAPLKRAQRLTPKDALMFKRILVALMAFFAFSVFAADANTATQADLEAIKGIGPAIATKIIDERKNGNYKDWPDLVTRVKGIGDKNAAKLSGAGLTVNGAAMSGAPAAPAAPTKTTAPAAVPAKTAAPATPATPATPAANAKPTAAAPAAPASSAKELKKAAAAQAKADKASAAAQKKADKAAAKADKAASAAAAKK
jgi:competence protein ComEA